MLKRMFAIVLLGVLIFSVNAYAEEKVAIFAGGCFWCLEADFDKVPGVIASINGYDGGHIKKPSYEQVSSGRTDYAESVKIIYDPKKVSYKELLRYFWMHVDPTVKDRQFCDHGKQYRTAIFYLNDQQKKMALASLADVKKLFKTVHTEVVPSTHFYRAENYHQNYYQVNPVRYRYYRWRCGRDARVKTLWQGKKLK